MAITETKSTEATREAITGAKFPLGQIVATPGAMEALNAAYGIPPQIAAWYLLKRHQSGNWGDMCEEDKRANEDALRDGERIFSGYFLPLAEDETEPVKIWVITEWDRSYTTLLLPEEY